MGNKSLISLTSENAGTEALTNKLCLIAWAVDAPSHSHIRKDGREREYHIINITDYVAEMTSYDIVDGKRARLMPGI